MTAGARNVAVWAAGFVLAYGVGVGMWAAMAQALPSAAALAIAGMAIVWLRTALARIEGALPWPRALAERAELMRPIAVWLAGTAVFTAGLAIARTPELPAAFALAESIPSILFRLVRARLFRPRVRAARGGRLVLVGRPEALHRALSEGVEIGAGGAEVLLARGLLEPGTRLRGLPAIDVLAFERALERQEVGRVLLVPPLPTSLSEWVRGRCRAASVSCTRVGQQAPSGRTMRALIATEPARLLGRTGELSDAVLPSLEPRIAEALGGRRVLIVGAGSSLGAELARRVLHYRPSALWLLDSSESAVARLEQEIAGSPEHLPPLELWVRVLDLRDGGRVGRVVRAACPHVILHAGGFRHLPLAERQPADVVLENVFGSRALVETALDLHVERFVLVSSCAAVNPTSVLGASQRLAERVLQLTAVRLCRTRFITVRLPNLLDAAGGVLGRFAEQIERGLPLSITHPEVARWFLTVTEAARCVLEGSAVGEGGELLLPDPGAAVRVIDLARRLCRAAGLRLGVDLPVRFTGLRPGERMQEQMARPDESVTTARHPSMWAARAPGVNLTERARFEEGVERLAEAALAGHDARVVHALLELVPEYRPPLEQPWRRAEGAATARRAAVAAQAAGGGVP